MRLVLFAAVLLVLGCHVSWRGVCGTVPGYLDFDNLPDTNFSCEGKVIGGYYADVETGCQMFHVCTIGQKGEITDIKFLCLNGTVFDQETRVCERVDEVDCSKTEGFYGLNLELYGNTGATYGLEEPEEADDHEESQSHHSHTQNSSPLTPTSPSPPPTPKSTSPPTTPTTVITTTSPPPSTTPAHPFTPPTTISTISSTLHPFSQKPHTVHFSSTSSPHSVSSSFLTFPSGGDHLFETAPEGSGGHSSDLEHFPPPSSSSSSWPEVNLQSGGGSGIIHQTDASPFHALKNTPKPLFGSSSHSNDHSNHQFIYSTTKAPSHFFSGKTPGGFSVTSHPPVTQFPLKNPGHLIQTNIPPDFYHDQQNRNRQPQKNSPNFLGHQSNLQIVPNPIHFQYSGRPTHQHQVFTTPSVQSTVISSTSSVSSVKTTIKHQDNNHNTQNPPASVNSFAFGINSGLSPTTFVDEKLQHNNTKHLATPPTSYDEYHERDVALDPFFKDVPRISLKQGRSNRRKRQTQEDIQRSRGSRRFRNKPTSQQIVQTETQQSDSIIENRRQSQLLITQAKNIVTTTPRINTDTAQEPNPPIPTTEITRRSSLRKQSFNRQVSPTSLTRDSTVQESQVQHSGLNDHRNNLRQQSTNIKSKGGEQQQETTSELPTTTRQPLPETSFTCDGKVVGGYYADPEADCQLFHICVLGRHGKIRDDKFLCGPGTRFDQKSRTCQTKHLVNCNLATSLYHVNLPYLFPEDNEPVPDLMFESHKVSKRATKKGTPHLGQDEEGSLDNPPDTDFTCDDKPQEGLYADVETNCKYFHLCQKSKDSHLHIASTFVCPPGTSFNQHEGNCDASEEIDCTIYSQPEHLFSKSKSRFKRNALEGILRIETKNKFTDLISRYRRNTDEEKPDTNFSCEDQSEEGLYADVETNCKYFHLCQKGKKGNLHLVSTFACPSGMSFNQQEGNCDASKEIECEIFSQPMHSFAKSKSRLKRNVLQNASKAVKSKLLQEVNHFKELSLENPPDTDFSCEDKPQEGLYADVDTDCKYFHLCQKSKNGLYLASTFVCPPNTAFNQHEGNCDDSKEIDCELYSQPEHTFTKSKLRNKRNILNKRNNLSIDTSYKLLKFENRSKRNADKESKGTHYADDEIQSAEREDHSDTSYESTSDEVYEASDEDIHSKDSEVSQENHKPREQINKNRNKNNSAKYPLQSNEEVVEISEENDSESQSLENSQIQSNEREEHSTESKETHISEKMNSSQDSHEIPESTEYVSEEETTQKPITNLKEYHATENAESEQDNASIEEQSEEEDENVKLQEDSHDGKDFATSTYKNKSLQETDDDFLIETKLPEGSSTEKPFSKQFKYESGDNDTVDIKQTDRIISENAEEINGPLEYSNDELDISENTSLSTSYTGHLKKDNSNFETQVNINSEDSQIKTDADKSIKDSHKDESKNSYQKTETESTFKSKVNQLLMKLNASVEDVRNVHVNSTNEDYYDYYTYDEPILELEELDEKILSADNSTKNKQTDSIEESNSSEIERNREETLAKEVLEVSSKLSENDKLPDSRKAEVSDNNKKAGKYDNSFEELENRVSANESDTSLATEVPEKLKTSTVDDAFISTTLNIDNETTTDKILGKLDHKTDNENPSSIGVSVNYESSVADKYEASTEFLGKTTDYSNDKLEQASETSIPTIHSSSRTDNENAKETSTSVPIDNSLSFQTDIPQKEIPFTNSLEVADTTIETTVTTISPDTTTPTTTTSAPATTSNLLHPYKSRPVYRTWRTTTPPAPVSIRPNSSLRLPRPSIRRGTNKGSNAVVGGDKERTKTNKEHTNQILPSEKSKDEQEPKNKYSSRPPKDKLTESDKSPTEKIPVLPTEATEHISDGTLSTITVLSGSTTTENIPTVTTNKDLDQAYFDSKSDNSHKAFSFSALDRTFDNDGRTPSPVLPTFSRKNLFVDREDQKVTKAGVITTTTTNPPTTTTKIPLIENLPITGITTEEIDSLRVPSPTHFEDIYKDTESGTFTCNGKELHEYLPDPLDCHLFHYCSQGFHNRQLLDFKFMCDKGTAFSPITHQCEKEDKMFCGNLHYLVD